MPSLIPGFEYDIFISYRQKDNKYDGWVNEFVSNLKKELEATFKEDVSIYYDENPHDGLLETHDVDDSLKEKLKSLVFIPIVSRTYCDQKSFAWKHEFAAFVEIISRDEIGPKVKLSNGNVASRILPVRIHDLEKEDTALFESHIGGVMRSVDFVYKTAGVNRPLRQHEGHPDENQNHINYRDQINKVANSIKEIIGGLARRDGRISVTAIENDSKKINTFIKHLPTPGTKKKRSIIAAGIIFFAIMGYLFYYHTAQQGEALTEFPGKSIAVLPFENLSGDPEQEYFSDGVAEEILIALAQIKDLKVAGRTSSFRFKGNVVDLQEVGEKLKVNTVLEGSVRRQGNRVKISAKLLNVADGYQLWSEQFERTVNDVFKIQEEIAVAISQRLKVTLLQNETLIIGDNLTQSSEAYDAVLKGRFFWNKRELKESEKYFKQAIELDSNFAAAYAGLAETYVVFPFFRAGSPIESMPKAQEAAEKAIQLDNTLTTPYFSIAHKKAIFDWDREEARDNFQKAFQKNSNYAPGYYWHAHYLQNFEGDFSGAVLEMRKAVEIEPLGSYSYMNLGNGLFYSKKFKEALDAYRFSIQLNNLNPISYIYRGYCNIGLGRWEEAQKDFETASTQSNDWARAVLVYFNMKKGNKGEAQKLYDDLIASRGNEYSSQYVLSLAASFLGQKDLAHNHFKKAFEERDAWLPYLINHPIRMPDDVLSDPRNMALMIEHFPFMKNQQ